MIPCACWSLPSLGFGFSCVRRLVLRGLVWLVLRRCAMVAVAGNSAYTSVCERYLCAYLVRREARGSRIFR